MRPPTPHSRARPGLSLLEVLVALAVFLFAFIVLGRLIIRGGDLALDAQQQAQAAQLCQAKLAEVVAGAVPLTPQTDASFDEAPDWQWSLDCDQRNVPGLWHVQVRVRRRPHQGTSPVEFTLSQMVLDPLQRGHVLDAPRPIGVDDTGGSTDSSGSSSGASGAKGGN
jgi:type II secretory pathway pseudopilin PulG